MPLITTVRELKAFRRKPWQLISSAVLPIVIVICQDNSTMKSSSIIGQLATLFLLVIIFPLVYELDSLLNNLIKKIESDHSISVTLLRWLRRRATKKVAFLVTTIIINRIYSILQYIIAWQLVTSLNVFVFAFIHFPLRKLKKNNIIRQLILPLMSCIQLFLCTLSAIDPEILFEPIFHLAICVLFNYYPLTYMMMSGCFTDTTLANWFRFLAIIELVWRFCAFTFERYDKPNDANLRDVFHGKYRKASEQTIQLLFGAVLPAYFLLVGEIHISTYVLFMIVSDQIFRVERDMFGMPQCQLLRFTKNPEMNMSRNLNGANLSQGKRHPKVVQVFEIIPFGLPIPFLYSYRWSFKRRKHIHEMWHGTAFNDAHRAIQAHGFARLQSVGAHFGQGIYLSSRASTSMFYANFFEVPADGTTLNIFLVVCTYNKRNDIEKPRSPIPRGYDANYAAEQYADHENGIAHAGLRGRWGALLNLLTLGMAFKIHDDELVLRSEDQACPIYSVILSQPRKYE